jgi:diguanylate cyclase (GGDEF)-like protein
MAQVADNRWNFAPYAQLISALLPRTAGVTVFAPDGDVRWTTEQSVAPSMVELVQQAAAEKSGNADQTGERAQLSGEPVYLFWLRNEAGVLKSVLALSWRSGDTEQRTFAYVHAMIKPVLECVHREQLLRDSIDHSHRDVVTQSDRDDSDLDVLLATSNGDRRDSNDDEIQHLLRNTTQHLQCEFTALVVPERGLVVISKAEGHTVDTSTLAKLHRHLLSLAQARSEPTILNTAEALPGVNLKYRVLSSAIRNPAGRANGVLALFRSHEAPEFRRRDAQLSELLSRRAASIVDSSYDALSGLLTRAAFEQRARVQMTQRPAGAKTQWSALYIDADRLHVVNDNYGMHVGDRLLTKMGELIRARLAPGALAARISGDRFAILLPTGPDDAMSFAEALRLGVESLTGAHLGARSDASFAASISIGLAAIADVRMELAHAMAVAETACKAAKDRGRNRVELYQASDVSIMRRYEDINIAPSLRAAINENRLRLDSQLLAPLPGSACSTPHFELLLRMIDDQGETVGPERFMSAAVRYQLMPAVDRWVVQEAMRLLAPHATQLASHPVGFTINLSGQSLGDMSFVDFLVDQVRASGIDPRVFCFEITESAAIANLARAEVMMKRLRELGCTVALDDFGTGLSSLAYLRSLPVDMLKIDGSFVRDVLKDPRAESMVQAVAQLARSMNLITVAEFVETDEIRLRVAQLGVDYGQGFAIARPVPLVDTIKDLPMFASVAKRQPGEELVLGAEDDTISVELQQKLFGNMVPPADDVEFRLERLLEGYDHSESAQYQRKSSGG